MIEVGDRAPDFTLRDQNNEEFTLSSLRGSKAVLIVFYPFAFTGICTNELARVQADLDAFVNDDVETVSISVDSPYSNKVFGEREGFQFRMLSDYWPHGAVAQLYGTFNDAAGFALRGTFLVDREGIVRFAEVNQVGDGRDPDAWRKAIESL
jgi:peroxiredoxin (alkyl hydroperoxide reductase subunit C)